MLAADLAPSQSETCSICRPLDESSQAAAEREAQVLDRRDHLLHREKGLDRDLLPYGDPAGNDVLVFGSGLGSEVIWAARHWAASVVAIDLKRVSPEPLRRVMQDQGISYSNYEFRRRTSMTRL